jgi:hypothetical protein
MWTTWMSRGPREFALGSKRGYSSTSPRTPTDEIRHPGRSVGRSLPLLGLALVVVAFAAAVIGSLGAH